MKKKSPKQRPYVVTKKGSLGLLAYGDLGFKAWRKTKTKIKK